MWGWCVASRAKPFGKAFSRRALSACACWIIVASGSSAMSMAVTAFSCALDAPAEPNSDTKPKASAAKKFLYRRIIIPLRYFEMNGRAFTRTSGRPGRGAPAVVKVCLLPFVRLHHLLDLRFDLGKVEGRGLLHRRVVDERLRRRGHGLLHLDEAPEFARHEVVHVAAAQVVERLAADRRRALERILAQVDDGRHVGRHLLARPAERLLVELELEVVDADGAELRLAEVEDLVPRRRSFAGDQIHLVIAVQVVLVGLAADLQARQ